MADKKYLVVNADDFGQSPGVNRGIIEAHEQGIVTSASLMVRWPSAKEAVDYGKTHPSLGLGLHFDLGEWACRNDEWVRLYEVIPKNDEQHIADELTGQCELFERLTGRIPTHLDSHQHAHRDEPLRSMMLALAEKLNIPLRDYNPSVRYCGDFYGQSSNGYPYPEAISVEALMTLLERLPAGITELGCHPGFADDLDTMYKSERQQEIKALCDGRIRETIGAMGIELCSFADLPVRVSIRIETS